MATDLKESGSAGSRNRMKKMTDRAYRKNTVTEGTMEDGSKITYRDKYRRAGKQDGEQMKKRTKAVRLEKDAEGKTYKTKSRKSSMDKKKGSGDFAMSANKKEISKKKYDRNMKRIEKAKKRGAKTETLRHSKEAKAAKKAK
jgi:hypothetical protein